MKLKASELLEQELRAQIELVASVVAYATNSGGLVTFCSSACCPLACVCLLDDLALVLDAQRRMTCRLQHAASPDTRDGLSAHLASLERGTCLCPGPSIRGLRRGVREGSV